MDMVRVRVASCLVCCLALMVISFSDAIRHASLLSSFLLKNSLYFGDIEIISFPKLVGNLEKMIVANLGTRQHERYLDSYIKRS